ncbi:ATP-dependent DNA helicase II subunit 2 [Pestalotiopsis sp. 9143b]|nr:ATP-dependent DNA helicase II subunit 2 [Pestalotiopsis sp. 9143b]
MADKEAVIYIVDLGSSMADCHNGRTESDLDFSMRWIWDKISTTVAASRKTWNVGVIGVRTDESNTEFEEAGGYENIAVLQELQPMDLAKMRALHAKIKPSNSETGDCISALVPAISMIETVAPRRLKFNRKIFMVTSGEAPLDTDDITEIADRLRENNIQLTILGVDFDDAEFGFKEEDKTEQKRANESLLKSLIDAVGEDLATFGTIAEAVDELDMPRLKQSKPYKTYDGDLVLGDPKKDPRALRIHVERYFKTKRAAPPSASNVTDNNNRGTQSTQTLDDDEMEDVEASNGGEFTAVKSARSYRINDPDGPGGKRDVDFESLAKGYAYGQTAVHISESDFNITKLETVKSFSILGFIQQDKFEPFLKFGESGVIVAQKNSDADALKLSSLVHSLHENESYALARIVVKDGKDPALPVPPMPAILGKYAFPDPDLVKNAQSRLDDLIATAELKKVPPKAKGRRVKGEQNTRKPISGLDVDALLREPGKKRTKVDPDNVIPSFKQMMDTSEDESVFSEAAKQIGEVIRELVTESFGDLNFDRATENLGVFRQYMVNFEEPQLYNDFLKDFKKRLFSGTLGGDRREFWFTNVRKPKLGLIDSVESDVSKITPEEASENLLESFNAAFAEDITEDSTEPTIDGTMAHHSNHDSNSYDDYSDSDMILFSDLTINAGVRASQSPIIASAQQSSPSELVLCPLKLIHTYPHRYAGADADKASNSVFMVERRTNSTQVSEFFKADMFESRAWDLYFMLDPEENKQPLLLAPWTLFVDLVGKANSGLGLDLKLPDRPADGFRNVFNEPILPRFLRVATSEKFLKEAIEDVNDLPVAPESFDCFDEDSLRQYGETTKRIYSALKATDKILKKQAKRIKAIRRQKTWGRDLKRAQRYLGLRVERSSLASHTPRTESKWDPKSCVPYDMEENVRLICLDVEADEMNRFTITEIGITILDTKRLEGISPGLSLDGWNEFLETHHLRIEEHKHIVNRVWVHGCPDKFQFGRDVVSRLKDLIGEGKFVLVGHDLGSDVRYLESFGLEARKLPGYHDEIDTKDIFRHSQRTNDVRSLSFLCRELSVSPANHFHNAGNDAAYTMQCLLVMVLRKAAGEKVSNSERDGWEPEGE